MNIFLVIIMTLLACCTQPTKPRPPTHGAPSNPFPLPSSSPSQPPNPSPTPEPSASPAPIPAKPNCTLVNEQVKTKWGTRDLPGHGKFVTESHYATKVESFNGKPFPKSKTDQIQAHLEASCKILRVQYALALSPDCHEVYDDIWDREWTPAEGGGVVGQAAREGLKPTVEQELWQGNMMYVDGALPAPGTKYLAINPKNNRVVVVSFGHEIGPEEKEWFGGLTTEVKWYLQDPEDTTDITIGLAKDQALPYGPLKGCP